MLIKFLTVHCSATQADLDIGAAEIKVMHLQRGFRTIGYHYVIRRDGTVEAGRPESEVGAHVEGHNQDNLGICMVGGINAAGKGENNFTQEQFAALHKLLADKAAQHGIPDSRIQGHRDWFGDTNGDGKIDSRDWFKECPCFDVKPWYQSVKDQATAAKQGKSGK